MNGENPKPAVFPCWICGKNEANSGEHKTKRSDLAAVLGSPTQAKPFYFHDLERRNKPIKSLAQPLKASMARKDEDQLRVKNGRELASPQCPVSSKNR